MNISGGVTAHLFAGSGDGPYTSIFVQIRYRDASLLFTGDAHCEYEMELLEAFGDQDFRANMLKVTHHGSSSGTATRVINAIRPGIAIASTGHDSGQRDTLDRLGGHSGLPGPGARDVRSVFETVVDGDIILRTDGRPYLGGLLYQVEFNSPGQFANDLGANIMSLEDVNDERTISPHQACNIE